MPDANRLETFAKYAAVVSALVAASVGIGQFRWGVSQSVRELEWKQAEMARTIINSMLDDDGWDAMSMLDWAEGRIFEIAPGTKVRILPADVASVGMSRSGSAGIRRCFWRTSRPTPCLSQRNISSLLLPGSDALRGSACPC